MNQRVYHTINELVSKLSERKPEDVRFVMTFGSQIRGNARPDSDLDIGYVGTVRAEPERIIKDICFSHPRTIRKISIFKCTEQEFYRSRNIVGTWQYYAVREGWLLYDSNGTNDNNNNNKKIPLPAPFRQVPNLMSAQTTITNFQPSVSYWMHKARLQQSFSDFVTEPRTICLSAHWVVRHACFALLAHGGRTFPYFRTIDRRPDMGQYESVLDGIDVMRVACWLYDYWDQQSTYTKDDGNYARHVSTLVTKRLEKIIG